MDDILSGKCTPEELTSQLSVEELAEFCVGTLRIGKQEILCSQQPEKHSHCH